MDKIIVRHTSIIINDYDLGDCPKLEHYFSVYDRLYHAYFPMAIEYIEETRQLIVPRGIDIYFLETLMNTKAAVDYKFDEFESTGPIMIKNLPRDDEQKEALRFILGIDEYTKNKNKSQLSVNLDTGKGKTYVTVAAIAYECIKAAIIASSIDWLNQWSNRIQEYTDISSKEIYLISGITSIAKLLNGMKDISKYKIFLICHDTISSYGNKYGWDKITELFKIMKIGIKVYDEAHLHFDNICKTDFYTNTCKTLYLTATPGKSDEQENDVYQLYFKNVPAIDLFDEDKDPRTEYIGLIYNSHPSPQQISKCKNKYGLDRNGYANYIVKNESFQKVLHIAIDMAYKLPGKVLFFIGTNQGIDQVKDWIIKNYPELDGKVGIYTSVIKDNKRDQLDNKIILSTTKSCGAAVDIKGLKATFVLAEPFKSPVLAKQTLGRTREKDTYYIELVDSGFFYIGKFYNYKKHVFKKYATSCSEIKMNDNVLNQKCNAILNMRSELRNPLCFNPIQTEVYDPRLLNAITKHA